MLFNLGEPMPEKVIIGDATLYLGDCLEILPTLDRVDLVCCDPPYGIGESSRKVATRGKLAAAIDYGFFDWDTSPASPELINASIAAADSAIIFGGNYFNLPPAGKWLVWDKLNGGNDFADCELAWTNLPGAVRIFRHMWNGMLRDSERGTQRVHPTQKPIALMAWCIEQAGMPQTILDPFMGSAATGCAALKLGRKFIGIEKDERYFGIACSRIEQAVAQGQLFAPERPKQEQMNLEANS